MADLEKLRTENPEWSNCLFFNGEKNILYQTVQESPESIEKIINLFFDYDTTVKAGVYFNGVHYHVHRFYDGLIYGRADPNTKRTDGFCIYRTDREGKSPLYAFITYELPNVSARVIPLMAKAIETIKFELP